MCIRRAGSSTVVFLLTAAAVLVAGCAPPPAPGPIAQPLAHPAERAPWQFAGVKGHKLTTDHYTVFTTTGSAGLRGGIAGFMEAARAQYVELTGLNPAAESGKLKVYLFGSRREWAALTEQIAGDSADTVLRVQAGGYCYNGICVFWDIGAMRTYHVAAHEGLHQFLHHATRQGLPQWAEEGLATQAEGFKVADGLVSFDPARNLSRLHTLRNTIINDRWRSAARLVSMTSMDNLDESPFTGAEYYGQLWALLRMVRSDEAYNAGLLRLCRAAADGKLHDALGISLDQWLALRRNGAAYTAVVGRKAFEHYIDADMDRFERRYLAYARQLSRLD